MWMKRMGPMSLGRSAGQILYDLAIRDVDSLVGTREKFASLLYSYFIEKDEPTENLIRILDVLGPISMVTENEVSFIATMARVATIELLGQGALSENKKDSDEG